jgi:hypothetical protein
VRYKYLFLLATAALATGSPASETAEPTAVLDAAEALALDAQHYAASYGVTEQEAMRRLLIMHGTTDQIADVEQQHGPTIAGIYFDNGPDFGLKVKVTGDSAPAGRRLVRKGSAVAGRERAAAARSDRAALRARAGISDASVKAAEELIGRDVAADVKFEPRGKVAREERRRRIGQQMAELKRQIPQLEMAVDDDRTEQAVLYVRSDPGDVKAKAEALLKLNARVVVVPTGIQPTHTRGGSKLVRRSDGALNCMTGFVAKRAGTETLGALTAGHCVSGGTLMDYTDKDGSRYAINAVTGMTVDSTSADLAFMTANHVAVGEFYADNSATPRVLTGWVSRAGTRIKSTTVNGSYICHLGQTSPTDQTLMQTCGEVTSTTGGNYKGGNTYVVVSNTQSGAGTTLSSGKGTLRCVRGDSGGPWFAYTSAYGIQSSCAWNDTAETITNIVVYTSVEYVPAISANLVY